MSPFPGTAYRPTLKMEPARQPRTRERLSHVHHLTISGQIFTLPPNHQLPVTVACPTPDHSSLHLSATVNLSLRSHGLIASIPLISTAASSGRLRASSSARWPPQASSLIPHPNPGCHPPHVTNHPGQPHLQHHPTFLHFHASASSLKRSSRETASVVHHAGKVSYLLPLQVLCRPARQGRKHVPVCPRNLDRGGARWRTRRESPQALLPMQVRCD